MLTKKVVFVIFIVWAVLMLASVVRADNGITFGKSTYNQAGARLIVNSLGDQPVESTDGNLGYNDYIPENAFKNNLKEQGYTQVWDAKPDRNDVIAVSYMGLKGDPRTEDVDWVLKSEYNKLNASKQADAIDTNSHQISINNSNNAWMHMNQDNNIAHNEARINDNAENIQKNSDRIDALEERNSFKQSIQIEARVYDTRRLTVKTFAKIDTNKESEIGIILTVKIGESYEERQIRLQEARLKHLEYKLKKLGL